MFVCTATSNAISADAQKLRELGYNELQIKEVISVDKFQNTPEIQQHAIRGILESSAGIFDVPPDYEPEITIDDLKSKKPVVQRNKINVFVFLFKIDKSTVRNIHKVEKKALDHSVKLATTYYLVPNPNFKTGQMDLEKNLPGIELQLDMGGKIAKSLGVKRSKPVVMSVASNTRHYKLSETPSIIDYVIARMKK